jgi:hypothetical protein
MKRRPAAGKEMKHYSHYDDVCSKRVMRQKNEKRMTNESSNFASDAPLE